jgi:DNA-directed RNA polymerase subunit RPC12/RpoP
MAEGRVYKCSACAHAIEAWDDGNPYYLDERGEKRYAHHPSPERVRCTGNDTPVLCLGCGAEALRDSAAPIARCPRCAARGLVATWRLEGRTCPYCKAGTFATDPDSLMIS